MTPAGEYSITWLLLLVSDLPLISGQCNPGYDDGWADAPPKLEPGVPCANGRGGEQTFIQAQ